MTFKPMLAATCEDTSKLVYPLYASPKLDGIRCIIRDGVAYSRNLKPIRNTTVQAWASRYRGMLDGLDGELISGEHDETVFNRTTSVVMSSDGGDNWTFHTFDTCKLNGPYRERYAFLRDLEDVLPKRLKVVQHPVVSSEAELLELESRWLAKGYEGAMVRSGAGYYKHGRATVKEGTLLKVKRFVDDEAEVIGAVEMMHNENEATTDELGRTKRSKHVANLRGAGVLGTLLCRGLTGRFAGTTFELGSGFNAEQRSLLWCSHLNGPGIVGDVVTYKHFPVGAMDKPRLPIFKGFRHKDDR